MATFHRKHYQIIAEAIRESGDIDTFIQVMIDIFDNDNHLFDEMKFINEIQKYNEGY